MNEHYYTSEPVSAHKERLIETKILGRDMRFYTDAGVFSRDDVDPGSLLLIETAEKMEGRVLDMGCGWGPVGLSLALENPKADFLLVDVNERAVELSERNRRMNGAVNARVTASDGFESVEGEFHHILSNPPIRAGKKVIYGMFDESFVRLNPGGTLTIVIRKQQGAPSAKKHLEEVFGNAEIVARDGGYWIIRSRKEQAE